MLLLPPFSPSRTHTKKTQHSSDFFNGGTAAFFSYYIRHADTTLQYIQKKEKNSRGKVESNSLHNFVSFSTCLAFLTRLLLRWIERKIPPCSSSSTWIYSLERRAPPLPKQNIKNGAKWGYKKPYIHTLTLWIC